MSERVLTVGGNAATRPISDFTVSIATEYYVGPNAGGAGDDGRAGKTKETSLATLEKAISLATASKNDIIYLLPGHAETISSAGGISLDKIGLRVINLGKGALAATFTFSATDATMTMTAASCSIEGFPIFKPSIDSVVSPLVISAADCKADIEIQDASSTVECVRGLLTTADADRLSVNMKYIGFTAGDACVNAIRLVGGSQTDVNVDFYGKASTAIVEFHTTAVVDADIKGNFYVSGTTDLSKNVVDTVTGSTWTASGFDGAAGAEFSGGSGNAIAAGDLSAINSNVSAVLTDTGTTLPAALAAGVPQTVLKSTGDLTASGTSVALFTVTGDVLCRVGATVDVAVTCTSATSTAEVGVAGNTACLCVQDAIDGTAFDVGDSWSLITAADANGAQMADEWTLIGNGVNIIMTVSVDDITAGDIDFYCQYIPLSSDGAIAAA